MIILDTNVISELVRDKPEPLVVAWLDDIAVNEVATTAITAAELLYGAARLPDGRRKSRLVEVIRSILDEDLRGRIEPFDAHAAPHYARLVTDREQLGRPIALSDAQIAAICHARRATLATRNTRDFEHTGISLVDPWIPG